MSEAELLEDKVDPSLDFALWARVLRFARPYRRALTWLIRPDSRTMILPAPSSMTRRSSSSTTP